MVKPQCSNCRTITPISRVSELFRFLTVRIKCFLFSLFSSPEQRSQRAIVLPLASALALASTKLMLKFYVKVFRMSLLPNPMMDLVHVCTDDGYWSKILHSTIPIPIDYLKVKVMNFYVQVLRLSF